MYVVCPETGDKQKTTTMHRNLLLLVNVLPVELILSHVRPLPERKTRHRQRQERVADTQKQTDVSDNSENDSDNDCSSRYWLRIPAERTEKRPNTYHEQLTVHQRNPTQEPVKKETHTVPEYLPNPILRVPTCRNSDASERGSQRETKH